MFHLNLFIQKLVPSSVEVLMVETLQDLILYTTVLPKVEVHRGIQDCGAQCYSNCGFALMIVPKLRGAGGSHYRRNPNMETCAFFGGEAPKSTS